ncbi:hypothetical protein IW262DRAFT_1530786, partial [Armillaria fumosa]
LGTSHTLNTPSLSSVLEDCIKNNYDFGTAYSRLRTVWVTVGADNHGTIQDELRRCEADDRKRRQESLISNRIVHPSYLSLKPRQVWDLCANRVVPWSNVRPISHAWMDANDRVDVQSPINEYEWPVPIPKDANLDLIWIEMLNLGVRLQLNTICIRLAACVYIYSIIYSIYCIIYSI